MSKLYYFCNNCGKIGHSFHQCKLPITSIGIIVYRLNKNSVNNSDKYEFLMIRRKDSLGYVDFIRGKYPINNKLYLQNIIDEMTLDEKNNLLNKTFDVLWKNLWGDSNNIQYRSEGDVSKEKYNSICLNNTLQSVIKNSKTKWTTPEWGFPKGRRNYQEKDLNCALREFEEETGYSKKSIKIIQNLLPIEEIFTGSNYKSYKHRYYISFMDSNENPSNDYQKTEVSKLEWMTLEKCLNHIRPYNLEKIEVITNINKILNEYRIY